MDLLQRIEQAIEARKELKAENGGILYEEAEDMLKYLTDRLDDSRPFKKLLEKHPDLIGFVINDEVHHYLGQIPGDQRLSQMHKGDFNKPAALLRFPDLYGLRKDLPGSMRDEPFKMQMQQDFEDTYPVYAGTIDPLELLAEALSDENVDIPLPFIDGVSFSYSLSESTTEIKGTCEKPIELILFKDEVDLPKKGQSVKQGLDFGHALKVAPQVWLANMIFPDINYVQKPFEIKPGKFSETIKVSDGTKNNNIPLPFGPEDEGLTDLICAGDSLRADIYSQVEEEKPRFDLDGNFQVRPFRAMYGQSELFMGSNTVVSGENLSGIAIINVPDGKEIHYLRPGKPRVVKGPIYSMTRNLKFKIDGLAKEVLMAIPWIAAGIASSAIAMKFPGLENKILTTLTGGFGGAMLGAQVAKYTGENPKLGFVSGLIAGSLLGYEIMQDPDSAKYIIGAAAGIPLAAMVFKTSKEPKLIKKIAKAAMMPLLTTMAVYASDFEEFQSLFAKSALTLGAIEGYYTLFGRSLTVAFGDPFNREGLEKFLSVFYADSTEGMLSAPVLYNDSSQYGLFIT